MRLFAAAFAGAAFLFTGALGASAASVCPDGAFVSVRQGDINNVEWVKHSGSTATSHAIVNAAATADGTVRLNADQSTADIEAWSFTRAGADAKPRPLKKIPGHRVLWWDYWPSTLEQVTMRAAKMHRAHAIVPLYELPAGALIDAVVDRENSFEWNVRVRKKKYTVLLDEIGR